MDLNDLRSAGTVMAFAAFLGVVWWAYSKRNAKRFEDAANLPFSDEDADRAELGIAPRNEQRKTS